LLDRDLMVIIYGCKNVWHLTMHMPPLALHTATQASNRFSYFHFVDGSCWLE